MVEQREGKLNRVSWETLVAGQMLAAETGWALEAAVVGAGVSSIASEIAGKKVGKIYDIECSALESYTPDAFSDHRGLGLTHRYPVSLEPERSGNATPDFPGLGHLQRLPANPLSFVLTLIARPGSQRPRNSPTCRRREVHRSGLDRFHGDPGTFTDVDELLQLPGRPVEPIGMLRDHCIDDT